MTSIDFSDGQLAWLRARLGVPDGERDPVPDDLVAVLTAQNIVREAEKRGDTES